MERNSREFEFTFYSEGRSGKIEKRITLTPFKNNGSVYNLGFGDVQSDGSLSDLSVSSNADNEAVFRSIVMAVYIFFQTFPDKSLFVQGEYTF